MEAQSLLHVTPDAKDYKPWSVDDMVTPTDPMNEATWVKDLGRGLTIGSLYDVRTDQPIPGFLFTKDALDGKIRQVNSAYTAFEMVTDDKIKDKYKLADVESSLAMSL